MTVLSTHNLSFFRCNKCHLPEIKPDTIPKTIQPVINKVLSVLQDKFGSYAIQIDFISITETIITSPDGSRALQCQGGHQVNIKPESENLAARAHKCMKDLTMSTDLNEKKKPCST